MSKSFLKGNGLIHPIVSWLEACHCNFTKFDAAPWGFLPVGASHAANKGVGRDRLKAV